MSKLQSPEELYVPCFRKAHCKVLSFLMVFPEWPCFNLASILFFFFFFWVRQKSNDWTKQEAPRSTCVTMSTPNRLTSVKPGVFEKIPWRKKWKHHSPPIVLMRPSAVVRNSVNLKERSKHCSYYLFFCLGKENFITSNTFAYFSFLHSTSQPLPGLLPGFSWEISGGPDHDCNFTSYEEKWNSALWIWYHFLQSRSASGEDSLEKLLEILQQGLLRNWRQKQELFIRRSISLQLVFLSRQV